MTCEFSKLEYDQILNPDFRNKMDGMVMKSAKDAAAESVRETVKSVKNSKAVKATANFVKNNKNDLLTAAVVTSSVVLSGSTPSQSGGPDIFTQISQDRSIRNGVIGGIALGLEEAILEKGPESIPLKAKAVAKKIGSGFLAGMSATHFADGNANAADYVTASVSAVMFLEETKAKDIIARFTKNTKNVIADSGKQILRGIDFRNSYWKLNKLIPEAHYNGNSQSQIDARDKALGELQNVFSINVYKKDRKGRITNKINRKVVNWLWNMMGDDHRLDPDEAQAIYDAIHKAQEPEEEEDLI